MCRSVGGKRLLQRLGGKSAIQTQQNLCDHCGCSSKESEQHCMKDLHKLTYHPPLLVAGQAHSYGLFSFHTSTRLFTWDLS